MSDKIFVKPKAGLKIRDEQSLQVIPEDGMLVKSTHLVRKHLKVGDLLLVTEGK